MLQLCVRTCTNLALSHKCLAIGHARVNLLLSSSWSQMLSGHLMCRFVSGHPADIAVLHLQAFTIH